MPSPSVLAPGWNQVANPFAFPVAWSAITVDPVVGAPEPLVEPPVVWVAEAENRGHYLTAAILAPFTGYFVRNNASQPAVLRVPPVATDVAGLAPARTRRATVDAGVAEDQSWQLTIAVRSSIGSDLENTVGVAPGALAGRDRYDRSDPPLAPGPAVSLYFPIAAEESSPIFLTADMRSPLPALTASGEAAVYEWNFDLTTRVPDHLAPAEVSLEFLGLESLPPGVEIVLVDRTLQREIDLRTTATYTIVLGSHERVAESAARFRLLVGDPGLLDEHRAIAPPTITRLLQNFPNPFRSGSLLRYDLAQAGEVTLMVYDVQGRIVRRFRDRQVTPGRFEILWRGDDDAGRPVPAGVYFFSIHAPGGVRQTLKMIRVD